MKRQDKLDVSGAFDTEGLDYALRWYSTFPEIKDKKFHELREQYLKARKALVEYVGYDELG